jgi:hypothetical protein
LTYTPCNGVRNSWMIILTIKMQISWLTTAKLYKPVGIMEGLLLESFSLGVTSFLPTFKREFLSTLQAKTVWLREHHSI